MRVTWLADVLHTAGMQLCPIEGWQGRGRVLTTVNGVVAHHTATPATTLDANVAKILRDGRADLPGPLCQLGLDRQGRFWLIADGKGNHNGHGLWANQSIGIEAYNDGVGEPWPKVQLDAYIKGSAAILSHLGLNEGHVLGHKETDPGRKTDPRGVDMDAFRRSVAALLRPTPEDDLMRYPDHGYLPIKIEANGKGRAEIDVPFDRVVSVSVKANDGDASIPKAVVAFTANPFDVAKTVVLAEGSPGTVGVVVGVVK